MPKIKVKLSEATGSKKNIQGALSSFATSISFSSNTTVVAQEEARNICSDFKNNREKFKSALIRDANRIEKLTIEFLEIDQTTSKKGSTSRGNHSIK